MKYKKAVLLQRCYISGSNEPLQRYSHSKLSKLAACHQLGFDAYRMRPNQKTGWPPESTNTIVHKETHWLSSKSCKIVLERIQWWSCHGLIIKTVPYINDSFREEVTSEVQSHRFFISWCDHYYQVWTSLQKLLQTDREPFCKLQSSQHKHVFLSMTINSVYSFCIWQGL